LCFKNEGRRGGGGKGGQPPPCRGARSDEVHPVLQFSYSWILTLSKFKNSDRKIKKDNWTLVYWAYSSIRIALNTPYIHTHRPPSSPSLTTAVDQNRLTRFQGALIFVVFIIQFFSWERERGFIKYFLDIFTISSATYYDIALIL